MIKIKSLFLLSILLSFGLSGCGKATIKDANLVESSYDATEELLKSVGSVPTRAYELLPTKPIMVASFVSIDHVQESSRFGRMLAEQMGSRIAQLGFQVIELKLRTNSVFIQEKSGEFMLSRELKDISLEHDAQAVLVGTYAEAAEVVYVTAKLISTDSGLILGSYDFQLPLGPNLKMMVRNRR